MCLLSSVIIYSKVIQHIWALLQRNSPFNYYLNRSCGSLFSYPHSSFSDNGKKYRQELYQEVLPNMWTVSGVEFISVGNQLPSDHAGITAVYWLYLIRSNGWKLIKVPKAKPYQDSIAANFLKNNVSGMPLCPLLQRPQRENPEFCFGP